MFILDMKEVLVTRKDLYTGQSFKFFSSFIDGIQVSFLCKK